MSTDASATGPVVLHIAFGDSALQPPAGGRDAARIRLDLPCLAGQAEETIFDGLQPLPTIDGVTLFQRGDLLVGHAQEPFDEATVEAASRRLYDRVLKACNGRRLYRAWNYVPRINAYKDGLEHYRAFCKGRSLAFEASHGAGYEVRLPAASAVGSDGRTLDVVFAAGLKTPRHVENPEQVPAYRYPREYGPRSPSFSRATAVVEGGRKWIFVSGTASIKGHATVGVGSLREQIDCTLDNLRLISLNSGAGESLGRGTPGPAWERHFKIYLRRADDLARARELLERILVFPGDHVTWLRSDICRAELDIEIEATLVR